MTNIFRIGDIGVDAGHLSPAARGAESRTGTIIRGMPMADASLTGSATVPEPRYW
jgi:hypothetical protein